MTTPFPLVSVAAATLATLSHSGALAQAGALLLAAARDPLEAGGAGDVRAYGGVPDADLGALLRKPPTPAAAPQTGAER